MATGGKAGAGPRAASARAIAAAVVAVVAALSFGTASAAPTTSSTTTTAAKGTPAAGAGPSSTTTVVARDSDAKSVLLCPAPPEKVRATAIGAYPDLTPLQRALDDLERAAATNPSVGPVAGIAVGANGETSKDTRITSGTESQLTQILEKPSGLVVDTTGKYDERLAAAGCTPQRSIDAAIQALNGPARKPDPTSSVTSTTVIASDGPVAVDAVELVVKDAEQQPVEVSLVVNASRRLDLTNVRVAFAGLPATGTVQPNLQLEKGRNTVPTVVTVRDPVGTELQGTLLFSASTVNASGTRADLDAVIAAQTRVTLARPRAEVAAAGRSEPATLMPAASTPYGLLAAAALVAAGLGAGLMFLFGRGSSTAPNAALDIAAPVAALGASVPVTPWPTRPPPMPGSWVRFLAQEPLVQIVEPEDAMRIAAQPMTKSLATWCNETGDVLSMAFWAEKIEGKGEDANPTFAFDRAHKRGLIAVYDGMGGAGAAPARQKPDGSTVSGAYVASRVAKDATQTYFKASHEWMTDPEAFAQGLHDELTNQLAIELQQCLPSSTKIAGSLRRELPTTLAAVAFSVDPNGGVLAVSLWAGDSRTHLLTTQSGLQQLTRDDTHEVDALQLLINDAPMTNVVCADRGFQVHHHAVQLHAPAVLVAATDGCFGYVATPSHYELLLLRSLQRSSSLDEWARALASELDGFTSDDSSLVLTAIGYPDFDALREAFAARAEVLEHEHALPFAATSPEDFETFAALRAESWERYRPTYEQLLPMLPTDRDGGTAAEAAADDATAEGGRDTTEGGDPDAAG